MTLWATAYAPLFRDGQMLAKNFPLAIEVDLLVPWAGLAGTAGWCIGSRFCSALEHASSEHCHTYVGLTL